MTQNEDIEGCMQTEIYNQGDLFVHYLKVFIEHEGEMAGEAFGILNDRIDEMYSYVHNLAELPESKVYDPYTAEVLNRILKLSEEVLKFIKYDFIKDKIPELQKDIKKYLRMQGYDFYEEKLHDSKELPFTSPNEDFLDRAFKAALTEDEERLNERKKRNDQMFAFSHHLFERSDFKENENNPDENVIDAVNRIFTDLEKSKALNGKVSQENKNTS